MGLNLKVDDLYLDNKGRMREFTDFYRVGRYEEKEKRDLLLKDLEKKQEFILLLLVEKEGIEEQLVSFGSIHHIYKTFKDTQDEMRGDIRTFVKEKHKVAFYLNALMADFEGNALSIGKQEGFIKIEKAKYKA